MTFLSPGEIAEARRDVGFPCEGQLYLPFLMDGNEK